MTSGAAVQPSLERVIEVLETAVGALVEYPSLTTTYRASRYCSAGKR